MKTGSTFNHVIGSESRSEILDQMEQMIDVGIALSAEQDTTKLLEKILTTAQRITHADGGTIYSVTANKELKFETLINNTLGMYMGGSSGNTIPFPEIPLTIDGRENHSALVAFAANTNQVINIPDAYQPFDGFDMTLAKQMDAKIGYRTQSVLTIPMTNHEGDLNGVLQLINAQQDDEIIAFSEQVERVVVALASQAAVALTNRGLIDEMEGLFRSFTKLLAHSIDEKSPYTGGHCRRVPEITMMLAQAANEAKEGPFADFSMNEADMYELNIAAWLHDCGKIATPEYVMDKATKLETVFDRIDYVVARFEIAKRDMKIQHLQTELTMLKNGEIAPAERFTEYQAALRQLDDDLLFLIQSNIGSEFMSEKAQRRVYTIAEKYQIEIQEQRQAILDQDLITNLSIAKGTLNEKERQIINKHITISIDMLDALPFPKHLQNVPEYAGGHHEKMDGTGYPKGLTREQMSVPARMMAIADIFEALTASDRPYKEAKTLSECLKILGFMKLDNHIDPDLFDLFIESEIYLKFAEIFLKPFQIDKVDLSAIPGYRAKEVG
ncbi:GAF domain-containing protein [Catenovulum sp. SM1970]|uniref:GAF and HD-GYP domain-containing protein n=1 Tax=Marinifaba aquimaris TaxID=2741323 RepID=UPI001574C6FF|nr:HD family phosphohydrolase [Marinifaba aquimaris]NTS75724.1 GAF domain-containing protein [Marinifaba aquimaris]